VKNYQNLQKNEPNLKHRNAIKKKKRKKEKKKKNLDAINKKKKVV
jgi:hypothetical protein